MDCKICLSTVTYFATARVLNKYDVQYFKCPHCGFVQTQEPFWLNEAYSEAIAGSDLGLIRRNIAFSRIAQALITVVFDSNAKFIDYGGGYGLFVRLMRDAGFDYYRLDELCPNLFARGFDADGAGRDQYELLSAFEVFEHLMEPMREIERMLTFSRNILLSTELLPPTQPKPGEWWYYSLEHGQHVSIYSRPSLEVVAEKFHLKLYSNNSALHLLTDRNIPSFMLRLLFRSGAAILISSLKSKVSLLPADYYRITGKCLE